MTEAWSRLLPGVQPIFANRCDGTLYGVNSKMNLFCCGGAYRKSNRHCLLGRQEY